MIITYECSIKTIEHLNNIVLRSDTVFIDFSLGYCLHILDTLGKQFETHELIIFALYHVSTSHYYVCLSVVTHFIYL